LLIFSRDLVQDTVLSEYWNSLSSMVFSNPGGRDVCTNFKIVTLHLKSIPLMVFLVVVNLALLIFGNDFLLSIAPLALVISNVFSLLFLARNDAQCNVQLAVIYCVRTCIIARPGCQYCTYLHTMSVSLIVFLFFPLQQYLVYNIAQIATLNLSS
jgi:hypothetical protein